MYMIYMIYIFRNTCILQSGDFPHDANIYIYIYLYIYIRTQKQINHGIFKNTTSIFNFLELVVSIYSNTFHSLDKSTNRIMQDIIFY